MYLFFYIFLKLKLIFRLLQGFCFKSKYTNIQTLIIYTYSENLDFSHIYERLYLYRRITL